MARPLSEYGFEGENFGNLAEFALEDPGFFEGMMYRAAEDLELALQISSIVAGDERLDVDSAGRTLELLEIRPPAFRGIGPSVFGPQPLADQMLAIATGVARGPLDYTEDAFALVGSVLTAIANDFLVTGAGLAAAEGGQMVRLRHLLPACERWPYPLNRYC